MADTFTDALKIAFMWFPLVMYFGLAYCFACDFSFREWAALFIPDDVYTIGDLLLYILISAFFLLLTPGAIVYFAIRWLLRVRLRKDK